ncbi:cysteine desulfurase family protein [Aureivirga sp. CE67]|uniref:cysteine desulfurase family protein n=1 Tax=Aureivirga sp. CE67 TaxID=1788983 RepID=UPI0018C9D0F7|nr:cysteine desulfurase family protein [Aureivirga sp. CE67]
MNANTIYFDNAATTPIDKQVAEVVFESMQTIYGNPSSSHGVGRKAKSLVEKVRKTIAKYLNVTSSEIIFTAGGSEADNLILRNAVVNLGVKTIISSKIEHHAVLNTVKDLQKEFDVQLLFVDVDENGDIDLKHLRKLLSENENVLVTLMYINNEIGNIIPADDICRLCQEYNALFHSDTVQAIGHYTLDLQKTPIDFITASAHKFHGPKGVGFAYFKKGFGVKPMLIGGEQEKGARAGTENVHSILGMGKAMEIAYENLEEDHDYILGLKKYFIEKLNENFENIDFNGTSGDLEKSSYITTSVRFPKEDPMFLFSMDLKGVAVSGGSACQSGSNKGSHVLNTILPKSEENKTSVRFSFSKFNTKEEIDKVIEILKGILNK